MSIGDFLESLSQAMLVGIMLVGRLGVLCVVSDCACIVSRCIIVHYIRPYHAILACIDIVSDKDGQIGRAILYNTATQRGWCTEVVVLILAHLQSQKLFPGDGGGVESLFPIHGCRDRWDMDGQMDGQTNKDGQMDGVNMVTCLLRLSLVKNVCDRLGGPL